VAGGAPPEPHPWSFLLGAQTESWRRSRRSWRPEDDDELDAGSGGRPLERV
jgi:hypothetical protein